MQQYRTKDGDTADSIAWNYYGSTDGKVVEQLLEANKGLSDYGPLLPPGLVVNLPKLTAAAQTDGVKLWD
jgi:phage tail protein X